MVGGVIKGLAQLGQFLGLLVHRLNCILMPSRLPIATWALQALAKRISALQRRITSWQSCSTPGKFSGMIASGLVGAIGCALTLAVGRPAEIQQIVVAAQIVLVFGRCDVGLEQDRHLPYTLIDFRDL